MQYHYSNATKNAFPGYTLPHTQVRSVPVGQGISQDELIISVPWTFTAESKKKYPTLYILDGYWDFPLVYGAYPHLIFDHGIQEVILVGLSYSGTLDDVDTRRRQDLSLNFLSEGARPASYLDRIAEEIVPFVESQYPCDPLYRGIAGVSIGGTFALSTLFLRPGLFQAAIALSSVIDGEKNSLNRVEEKYYSESSNRSSKLLARKPELNARIFMGYGKADNPDVVSKGLEFDAQLTTRQYRFLEKEFRLIEGEKHGGVKPEGFNRGLRHIFPPI